MANQFVALPVPAANGAGAWVDVSTFGAIKTITLEGNGGVFEPFVIIEGSNELVPDTSYPIASFNSPTDEFTVEIACHWMRATVQNYKGGGAPTVEIGGTDDGSSFAQVAVPAGNGVGAGTDVSALGLFKTVQVGGAFRGQVNVEISEDGGVTWSQAFSFAMSGQQSAVIAADFMRVSRVGVPPVSPGTPDCWVGAANPTGGGGGGSLIVQLDEVDVVNPATTLDFQSPGTLVTDAGGGVAKIWATLFPVTLFNPEIEGATVNLVAGKTNNINPNTSAVGLLPLAASVPNGVPCLVRLVSGTHEDGASGSSITFTSQGGDTIDLYPTPTFPASLTLIGETAFFVSDGVSNWNLVASSVPTAIVPTEQAFVEPVSAATDPTGFSVAFPTDFAIGAELIFSLALKPPTIDDVVEVFILSFDESQVTLGATSNFANGTFVHITARVKTGGP